MKRYKVNNYLILRCLFSWHYSWYQIMWVFHTNSDAVTTGYPRIAFNSDNMWSFHNLHSVRIQFQKTATLQTPTVSPRGQPYFDLTIYKLSGSHKALFRFDNLLEWLRELRKALYLSSILFKGYKSGPAKWRDIQAEEREDPNAELLPILCQSGSVTHRARMNSPTRRLHWSRCREFVLGFITMWRWMMGLFAAGDQTISASFSSMEAVLAQRPKYLNHMPGLATFP